MRLQRAYVVRVVGACSGREGAEQRGELHHVEQAIAVLAGAASSKEGGVDGHRKHDTTSKCSLASMVRSASAALSAERKSARVSVSDAWLPNKAVIWWNSCWSMPPVESVSKMSKTCSEE